MFLLELIGFLLFFLFFFSFFSSFFARSLALEYNLASEKALAQMRSKITKGQADQSDQVKKLTRRLGPVLALKDEIKKLQAEIQAATKK